MRLTYAKGTSNKFWEGRVEGRTLVVRFGKNGTEGQTKKKALASSTAATAELEKLIGEKRRKGYVQAGAPAAGKPVPAKKTPRRAAGKTPSIAELWASLEEFVATTPQRLHLNPPAKEKAIRAAERTMKQSFPDDFRASLLVHDGQEKGDGDDTFPWLSGHPRLASLDRIVEAWKDQCETHEKFQGSDAPIEIDKGRMMHYLWHPKRIPIAGNPWWDQDNTYLDFIPGPNGAPGQLVCFGKGYVDGLWCSASFGAAFALYVDAVVSRKWLWEKGCFAADAKDKKRRRMSWSTYAAKQRAP
ncbi:MAG: WGR domain-containing protein [Deltaproteobacteria bacterium]|nr:WGR domain-containing protein [Deltaproteobacteria bacterium]